MRRDRRGTSERTDLPRANGLGPARASAGQARSAGSAAVAGRRAPPSESVRGAITLAVSIYIVGLLLTVAAHSGSGTSALVGTVHDTLFAPWMVPAWLDLGFAYRLTFGLPDDADHRLEVRPWDSSRVLVSLPEPPVWGERAARWRRLARAIAESEADADREGLLTGGAARGLFAVAGADDLMLRVVRTVPPDRDAAATEPRREDVWSGRLRRVAGRVQVIRDTPREELAPLVAPPVPSSAPGA